MYKLTTSFSDVALWVTVTILVNRDYVNLTVSNNFVNHSEIPLIQSYVKF